MDQARCFCLVGPASLWGSARRVCISIINLLKGDFQSLDVVLAPNLGDPLKIYSRLTVFLAVAFALSALGVPTIAHAAVQFEVIELERMPAHYSGVGSFFACTSALNSELVPGEGVYFTFNGDASLQRWRKKPSICTFLYRYKVVFHVLSPSWIRAECSWGGYSSLHVPGLVTSRAFFTGKQDNGQPNPRCEHFNKVVSPKPSKFEPTHQSAMDCVPPGEYAVEFVFGGIVNLFQGQPLDNTSKLRVRPGSGARLVNEGACEPDAK